MNDNDFWLVAAVAATIVCWVAYLMGLSIVGNIFAVGAISLGLYVFYTMLRRER